jgi:DUF1365 family protein
LATGDGGGVGDVLLFRGRVMHARLRPRQHVFSYPIFFLRLRVDALDRLSCRFLSVDGFNLVSFHRRDHGPRDGSDLLPWIRDLLAREGCGFADGEIWLQSFPRVLGYVFNPVSFWLCHDREGGLRAVLCEVNNTFGEHHNYLLAHEDGRLIRADDVMQARKIFHVSPFFPVSGRYSFRFAPAEASTVFRIDYEDDEGKILLTSVSGQGQPLRAAALLRCFLAHPWMTMLVIVRIHWQALRLWRKGIPFLSKPVPPTQETSR